MADERVRIELGFVGGQIVGSFVEASSADELESALGSTGARQAGRRPRHRGRPAPRGRRAGRLLQADRPRRPRRVRLRLVSSGAVSGKRRRDELSHRGRACARVDRARAGARRARPAGRPRRARGAVPDPLRPDLQLPPRQRRQPPRRRGPHDADLPQDAGEDRQLQVAVGAVLGLAVPDRPQPRDGPLPRRAAAGSRRRRSRSRRARRSRPPSWRRCRRSAASRC